MIKFWYAVCANRIYSTQFRFIKLVYKLKLDERNR